MKKLVLTTLALVLFGAVMAQSGNHWSPIPGTQYNMTVNGVIVIDGVQQSNNQLEIGAFCGDECRGSRRASFFPPTGEYVVPIAIVSNALYGETITFRIYDHGQQQELDLISESTLDFVADAEIGFMNDWFPFVFTTPAVPDFHFVTAGNWSNASNWSSGILPGAEDEVFIDAACQLDQNATVGALTVTDGQALTLQSGKTLTVTGVLTNAVATGLVIKDGAQLINATANVSATMEKDIVAYTNPTATDGWYTIASPMNEMPIAGSDFLTERYDLYRFNERNTNLNEWENYKTGHDDFTTFENGRGYLYANSNTFSPAFTGTLNTTTVTRPLTYTERPDELSGFNLIGNPFPHVIYKGAGGAIDSPRLASGYYTLTNEGVWHVHTFEDAIQPGQGLLVKTIASTDLSITKSNAVATSEYDAKARVGRMNISVTGNSGQDRAFVYFGQGIGLNKMDNFNEQAPSLWIRDNGNDYAIAHIDNNYESLNLYFHNKQSGNFTLSVTATDTNFSYLQLTDRITGATVDLLQQPNYSFHATGQEYEARFEITFKVATGVEEYQQQNFCFVKGNTLYLLTEIQGGQLTINDVMGRTVKSMTVSGNACSVADLSSGVYVVRLNNGTKTFVQKIVINH